MHSTGCQLHGSTFNPILSGNNSRFTDLPWIAPQITLWKSWQTLANTLHSLQPSKFMTILCNFKSRALKSGKVIWPASKTPMKHHETSWNQPFASRSLHVYDADLGFLIESSCLHTGLKVGPYHWQNMPQTCRPCPKKSRVFNFRITFWQIQSVLSCAAHKHLGNQEALAVRWLRENAEMSLPRAPGGCFAHPERLGHHQGDLNHQNRGTAWHSLKRPVFSVWRKHMKNNKLTFFLHIQGFKSNQGSHVILVALICSINIEPFRKNRESKKLNLALGLRVTFNSATLKFTREEPPSGLLTLRMPEPTVDPTNYWNQSRPMILRQNIPVFYQVRFAMDPTLSNISLRWDLPKSISCASKV